MGVVKLEGFLWELDGRVEVLEGLVGARMELQRLVSPVTGDTVEVWVVQPREVEE